MSEILEVIRSDPMDVVVVTDISAREAVVETIQDRPVVALSGFIPDTGSDTDKISEFELGRHAATAVAKVLAGGRIKGLLRLYT